LAICRGKYTEMEPRQNTEKNSEQNLESHSGQIAGPMAGQSSVKTSEQTNEQRSVLESDSIRKASMQVFEAVESVVWVRHGALGDLFVGLASLAETRAQFPNARLAVLGPKLWLEILDPAQYPWISEIAVGDRKSSVLEIYHSVGDRYVATGERVGLQNYFRKFQASLNTRIDSLRFAVPAWRARVPIRIGAAPFLWRWLFTHPAPWFGKDPMIHERDAVLILNEFGRADSNFLSALGDRSRIGEYIQKSRLIQKWTNAGLPPPIRLAGAADIKSSSKKIIYINPTASRREKAWPAERFRELALGLQAKAPSFDIYIIGAPSETDWLSQVAGSQFKIVQPKNIRSLLEHLAVGRLLVTNTSSMQFAAACMQCQVFTLMGRAKPEIWGPVGPGDQTMGSPVKEFQSNDIFQQEVEAFAAISVDSVLVRVIRILQSTDSSIEKLTSAAEVPS
jgi:ADP-heptose:LPS heptosyltransferase